MKKAVAFMAAMAVAASAQAATLQVKGSDTLINIVQKLAEDYMTKAGAAISVTGGGSGTGISALLNKQCDLANSSRLMKDKEIAAATEKGIDVRRIVVAIDGLAVIVNPASGVTQLTKDQVGKIFRGDVTDWSQVGGTAGAISLYGRQSNSGTYEFLREVILKGEYSSKMNNMNGNAQIVEAVKSDLGGIGYVGVGYVKDAPDVTVLKIAAKEGATYESPLDTEAVKSGAYAIARPLNQYFDAAKLSSVKAFVEYELSDEGQKTIEAEGFFAIPAEYQEYNRKSLE
jgi:phosphate transport system substrate-binding protein